MINFIYEDGCQKKDKYLNNQRDLIFPWDEIEQFNLTLYRQADYICL